MPQAPGPPSRPPPQTNKLNGWEKRVLVYKNAVAVDRRLLPFRFVPNNPGSTGADTYHVGPALRAELDAGGLLDGYETVRTVQLDDLFDGSAGRPVHPFLGRPIAPADVASVFVDTVSYEAAALWGMRQAIEFGLPPLISFRLQSGRWPNCDTPALLRWLYGLGCECCPGAALTGGPRITVAPPPPRVSHCRQDLRARHGPPPVAGRVGRAAAAGRGVGRRGPQGALRHQRDARRLGRPRHGAGTRDRRHRRPGGARDCVAALSLWLLRRRRRLPLCSRAAQIHS